MKIYRIAEWKFPKCFQVQYQWEDWGINKWVSAGGSFSTIEEARKACQSMIDSEPIYHPYP